MQIDNQIKKFNVSFPDSHDTGGGVLTVARTPARAMQKPSRTTAKLIGAGLAVAGAGVALHAVSQLPKSRAQQFTGSGNVMPNPGVVIEQAVNGMINQVIGAMNQVGCVSVCVWDQGSIRAWCQATVGLALQYARVPGGAAGVAGANMGVFHGCSRLINNINVLCAQANCR